MGNKVQGNKTKNEFKDKKLMRKVKVKQLHDDVYGLPEYLTDGAAGFDFFVNENHIISPNEQITIHSGFAFEIPKGYEMEIRPRSGLSVKFPNYLVNSPGTIDSDYRGEVLFVVRNNRPQIVIRSFDEFERLLDPDKCKLGANQARIRGSYLSIIMLK